VKAKKDVLFQGTVSPVGTFSFSGTGKHGKLGKEIKISVDGEETKIHTSCSKPISLGMTFGPFTVLEGQSLKGGPLCPIPDSGGPPKTSILKHSGVPGKGIDKAPGLQKPFNPNSQAAEHAGKKGGTDDEDATQNKGEAKPKMKKQPKTTTNVENQAGNDKATDDKGKGKPKDKKKK